MSRPSLFAGRQFAERKELAAAPHAEHSPAADPFGNGQSDQLVIDWTVYARLDTALPRAWADQDVGRWFAGQHIVGHADRMVGSGGNHLVDICPEGQGLPPTVAGPVEFHRDKWRVLHLDAATFGGRLQPEGAISLAFQHA